MTLETSTNLQSYKLIEGRIARVGTERESVRPNGELLREWMLRHEIPETYDMHVVYLEIARRLHQLAQPELPILAEAEGADLYSFGALPSLESLAEAQEVQPVESIDDLVIGYWPENENVEDFIAAATEGRHEEEDEPDF